MPEELKNTGLLEHRPHPKDYVAGGTSALPAERFPDNDWRPFKPMPHELQLRYGRDFLSCTNFAGTDTVEAYLLRKFGIRANYSDRALAILAGQGPNGNSLWNVVEAIRKFGLVAEETLPWTEEQDTFEKFITCTPEQKAAILAEGEKWKAEYDFQYEFAYDDYGPGMEELLYSSPLFAAALYASEAGKGADGVYYTQLPNSPLTTHAFVLLHQTPDAFKFIDDSYATQEKKLARDFRVPFGIRIHIAKKSSQPPMPTPLYYPPKNSYVSVNDTGERLGYVGGETIIRFATNGDALAEMMKRNSKDGLSQPFPMVDVLSAQIAHLKRVKPNGEPI